MPIDGLVRSGTQVGAGGIFQAILCGSQKSLPFLISNTPGPFGMAPPESFSSW
jgi:hypothetical protein